MDGAEMVPWWTVHEDLLLRRLYAQGTPLRTIAEQVGRSADAVSERRRSLGIASRPRSRPWSSAEDELLLGVARAPVPYMPVEDDAIAVCWLDGGDVAALARELGRPAGSLRLRAQKLGLHHPTSRPRWRPDEDAALRDGYGRGLTCAQIAAELAERTASAVAARAAKLGLATYARTWTPREDRDLRQLARDAFELERAAQLMSRTPDALRARARKLGIAPPTSRRTGSTGRRWTSAENELLALHSALNPAALAELLNRSPQAITQRLRRLGLRDGAERSPHHPVAARGRLTPGERAVVTRELRSGGPRRHLAVAQRLGLRPADIRRHEDESRRRQSDASDPLPLD
ncbi:MAG: hypothetical protein WKF42_03390 [Solirubrobacteraceae bacterium]